MKIHRPVFDQTVTALSLSFSEGHYADKVLERLFKNQRQLGARDRRFIAETFYECVRWWRRLWFALNEERSLDETALRRLVATYLIIENRELPAWPEFTDLLKPERAIEIRNRWQNPRDPATEHSVPDWLYDRGDREIGAQWPDFLSALNKQAPVFIRANRLKTNRRDLQKALEQEGVVTSVIESTDDGLRLNDRRNIFSSVCFQNGWFEVQDVSSQHIAMLLDPQPGERVIDACAGAGRKSLHIAALMGNKGKIIALDVVDAKLDQLRKRAKRGGVDIIESRKIESSKVIKRLAGSSDRLLLDVPCSGLGVLRRNPDSKWKQQKTNVDAMIELQAEILRTYSSMLKASGTLVYATCSILPSENERQIERFLETEKVQNRGWQVIKEVHFRPGENDGDGFYACKLLKLAP